MKALTQINEARGKLAQRIQTPGLSVEQRCLIAGMINALVWSTGGEASSTVDRLLSDEPMEPGKSIVDCRRAKAILDRWNAGEQHGEAGKAPHVEEA